MGRATGMALALIGAVVAAGCGGEGSGTGTMPNAQGGGGQGGMAGLQGSGATGSTWAPVIFPSGGMTGGGGIGGSPQPPFAGMGAGMVAAGIGGVAAGGIGGMAAAGIGGMDAGGIGGVGAGGTGGTPMVGDATPTIPAVTADCPSFNSGTITFMGLGGILIDSGPKPASPTAPMLFYWHGTGGFASEYGGMAGAVAAGVKAEGGIVVSFQGTTGGDLLSGTFIFGESDFALTDQLVACAVRDRNIDPRRIYATGCSAGGLFSAAMAARRSSYLAAAAPNSGGWTIPVVFDTAYTPALMTVHGAAGVDVVAVDFSDTSRNADMAFKNRGGFVINCDHGGFHCGGGSLAADIWEFFKAHPYGVKPHPWTSGLPAGFHRSCKIF